MCGSICNRALSSDREPRPEQVIVMEIVSQQANHKGHPWIRERMEKLFSCKALRTIKREKMLQN